MDLTVRAEENEGGKKGLNRKLLASGSEVELGFTRAREEA